MPVYHPRPSSAALPPLTEARHTPVIEVSHLHFSYADGHKALHDITFSIHAGEKVALVGPNGAGKSTLMLHLNGILGGDDHVRVYDLPTIKANLPRIRALVGLVFQNPDDQLFSPTVLEDVAFGPLHMGLPEADVRQRVQAALAQVGMSAYAQRLSHHLSVGEKKRITIATVLSMQPELLALDEPSAGLDPRARRQLIELLRQLPQTMLISTHDLLMVGELCPRALIIDTGRLVADGNTAEILSDAQLLHSHGLELPHIPATLRFPGPVTVSGSS
ncbi:MAG: ABC transporter ATP-binding protein [Chloroflexi bacterium]|nr:ABC transporter ATP-binding protein [Chloroflexota bacterium]